MIFKPGSIHDVLVWELARHTDQRGWLMEFFRQDEIDIANMPVMGYVSMTEVDVARGPHEHKDQSDFFAFLGPSTFKVYMWDTRPSSPTYGTKQVILAGEQAPKSVIIPPGVVHAYRNVGGKQGMVVNCPNRLFAGAGKKEPVDEIRHEGDPNSQFLLD